MWGRKSLQVRWSVGFSFRHEKIRGGINSENEEEKTYMKDILEEKIGQGMVTYWTRGSRTELSQR